MLPKYIDAVLQLAGVRRAYLADGRIVSREALAELIAEYADWEPGPHAVDFHCPGCSHPVHQNDCSVKNCECIARGEATRFPGWFWTAR